jgi:4'-phosphopantetheinyl transferase
MPPFEELPAPAPYRLWRVSLGERPADEELACLSPAEHERARRFVFEPHRNRYLGGHVALRQILSAVTGQPARDIRYDTGAHGKPSLVSAACSFNFSDSGDVALVATAPRGEIGIDVEAPRVVRDALALAERFFMPAEYHEVAEAPVLERDAVFLRGWTRKEACLKAIGSGLSISPETFLATCSAEPLDVSVPTANGTSVVRVESLATPDRLTIALARVLTTGAHD